MDNNHNKIDINTIISILSQKDSDAEEEVENIIKDKTQATIVNTLLIYMIKKHIDKEEIKYVIDNCIQTVKKKMISDCHSRAVVDDVQVDYEDFAILLNSCMNDVRDNMNSLLL